VKTNNIAFLMHGRGGLMSKHAIAGVGIFLLASTASAQDAMQYGVKHLKVLAEDDHVRVLKYNPSKGDKTPMHSHPSTVLYVIKGGRLKITLPDGSISEAQVKSGDALLRAPVTHADEAIDDVEAVLIELKR
jgi:quercetin dioxygenase-like cupin family protein